MIFIHLYYSCRKNNINKQLINIPIELNSNETLVQTYTLKINNFLFNELNTVFNTRLNNESCVITKVETLSKLGKQEEREERERKSKIYNDILNSIKESINTYFESVGGVSYPKEFIKELYDKFNNLNEEIFESTYRFTELERYFIINCYPIFCVITIIDAILLACKERDQAFERSKKAPTGHGSYSHGYIH